jgi:hypothetical protein
VVFSIFRDQLHGVASDEFLRLTTGTERTLIDNDFVLPLFRLSIAPVCTVVSPMVQLAVFRKPFAEDGLTKERWHNCQSTRESSLMCLGLFCD